jgi:ribulose-5-phosphate 4-epimerase/fuculose-1-phosphate aldolase
MSEHKDLQLLAKKASDFVVGAEGNVSKKDGDLFYIKSSGSFLKNLNDDEIVCYDFFGNQKSNFSKKGSMESKFHSFLLQKKDINYVCHTHPVNTLKILCSDYANEFANKRIFPDQVIFNEKKSCLIPYNTPGEDLFISIEENVSEFITNEKFFPKLILLKNHGIIACGKSVEECIVITEICEKSAEIFLGCNSLGKINFLSDEDIQKLIGDKNEIYRKNLL